MIHSMNDTIMIIRSIDFFSILYTLSTLLTSNKHFNTLRNRLSSHHYPCLGKYNIFQFQFNSYVYFRHKKSIYNKIYIQLDKIYIRIYNNAIRSIRTKKVDFKENIFIMLQCRTTNSKCLRRLEPKSHK